MQIRPLRWYERFQLRVGVTYQLFPSRDMSWGEWAFSPSGGLTRPGQTINGRYQLPESFNTGVDSLSVTTVEGGNRFVSLVFWLRGAVRILGFDLLRDPRPNRRRR